MAQTAEQQAKMQRLSAILHEKMLRKYNSDADEQLNSTLHRITDPTVSTAAVDSTSTLETETSQYSLLKTNLNDSFEHIDGQQTTPTTVNRETLAKNTENNSALDTKEMITSLTAQTSSNSADSQERYCTEFDNNYRYYCLSTTTGKLDREKMIEFCTSYEKICLKSIPTKSAINDRSSNERKPRGKPTWFESSTSERTDNDVHFRHVKLDDGDLDLDLKTLDFKNPLSKVEISLYCDDYSKNYLYFCLLPIKKSSALRARLLIFCPAYEKVCGNRSHKTNTSTDPRSEQSDPFVVFQELKDPKKVVEKLQQNKNPVPCKPDCDQRIWPHCTPECKCDYMYPYVQAFCNPPPMALFLQTCRLWYRGCPMYEQFHYASQFIHSKADKGKVLPGVVDNRPHADPNIVTMPIQRELPLSTDENENVNWETDKRANPNSPTSQSKQYSKNLSWYDMASDFPFTTNKSPSRTNVNSHKNEDSGQIDIPKNFWTQFKTDSRETDTSKSEVPRDVWDEIAKRANDIPTDDRTKYARISRSEIPRFNDGEDSSVHRFDKFSDSRGLVHQRRTKSPFTKPGLWEPNPDNPHNRDHANKFYYAPTSVTADWLSGQLAWGSHWAVPAASVGGTNGYSTVHFPSIGSFLGIEDDYD